MLAVLVSLSSAGAQNPTVGLLEKFDGADDGYTLFAPMESRTTYLIDRQGRLVHSWESAVESPFTRGFAPYLLEDGSIIRPAAIPTDSLLFVSGGTGRIERIAWDGTLIWHFDYFGPLHLLHHDIEVLPNGNVLATARETKTAEEAIQAGRNPDLLRDDVLYPNVVLEIEPTLPSGGNIVWEWHVWDHLIQDYDSTVDNYGVVADHPELIDVNFISSTEAPEGAGNWNHINSIDYNPELEQIMLSVRMFSELWVIDHSTTTDEAASDTGGNGGMGGGLLYRWGNPMAYRAGDESDQQLFVQHDAQWIMPGYPGTGNILVFNNGTTRPGGDFSTVDELVPPVDEIGRYTLEPGQAYGPAEPLWTYEASNASDFYSQFISGAQRLLNGNTLIDEGGSGRLFEVTADGDIVWTYVNPVTAEGPVAQGEPIPPALQGSFQGNYVFKVNHYPPEHPGLVGRDLTPAGVLELPGKPTPSPTNTLTSTATPSATPTPTSTPAPVVNVGDVNGDGEVNAVDAALVSQFIAGLLTTLPYPEAADVDLNGVVDAVDTLLILQYAAGLLPGLPV